MNITETYAEAFYRFVINIQGSVAAPIPAHLIADFATLYPVSQPKAEYTLWAEIIEFADCSSYDVGLGTPYRLLFAMAQRTLCRYCRMTTMTVVVPVTASKLSPTVSGEFSLWRA